MFNIVGLDVSESQLEQGNLILKFYIIFLRRRSKKFFTYISGRAIADFFFFFWLRTLSVIGASELSDVVIAV